MRRLLQCLHRSRRGYPLPPYRPLAANMNQAENQDLARYARWLRAQDADRSFFHTPNAAADGRAKPVERT